MPRSPCMFVALLAASTLACAAPPEVKVDVHAPTAEVVKTRAPATIEVAVAWPGASAIEVERAITTPLEQALGDVEGMQDMRSTSTPGVAVVTLVLTGRAQVDGVRLAVRERLAGIQRSLPVDVLPPSLGPDLDPDIAPVIFTVMASAETRVPIDTLGANIRDALARVSGVGAVELCGARDPQLTISLDGERMAGLGVTVAEVSRGVRGGLEAPSPGRATSLEDLAALTIVAGATPVRLRDLATIAMQPSPAACEAMQVGGGPAVIVVVRARRGATDFAAGVRARIAGLQPELPPGFIVDVPAEPVRIELELSVGGTPHESVVRHARAISGALAGLERPAFLRAAVATGTTIDAEVLVPALAAEKRAATEQALRALPGLYVRGITGAAVDRSRVIVEIAGEELATLQRLADETLALVLKKDGSGVADGSLRARMEATVAVDVSREQVAAHGVSAADVQATLAAALFGVPVGRVNVDGAAVPVVITVGGSDLDLAARSSIAGRLKVGMVPLSELASFRVTLEPAAISHVDRRRSVSLELRLRDPGELDALQRVVARELQLPRGYVVTWPARAP